MYIMFHVHTKFTDDILVSNSNFNQNQSGALGQNFEMTPEETGVEMCSIFILH